MAGKFDTVVSTVDRAVRDMMAISGDVRVLTTRLEAFEGEMRSRLSTAEDRSERKIEALEARMDRAFTEFEGRLRDIEQQLARLTGFMGQIEGQAASFLVKRALELQQGTLPVDGKNGGGAA